MYTTTYQSRMRRIEKTISPIKYGTYMVSCCNDGKFKVKCVVTGITNIMNVIEYQAWEKRLTYKDVVIIDDV